MATNILIMFVNLALISKLKDNLVIKFYFKILIYLRFVAINQNKKSVFLSALNIRYA